jgi:putative FmdB family regulatory protein
MPLYEYACSACRSRFERLVRRLGDAVACPACGSAEAEKQPSVFAVGSSAPSLPGCEVGPCEAGPCGARGTGPGPGGGGACGLPS